MKKLSITWMVVAAIGCNLAQADTYNFIFEKPKKPGAAAVQPESAPAPKVEATNAAPVPAAAPTIINNNVSVPQTDSAPSIGGPASDASTVATISAPPDLSNRSRYWTLGLSTGGVGVPAIYGSGSGSSTSTYVSQQESIFVQLMIGYRIARYLNSNTMLSIGVDNRAKAAFLGSDLEWLPIRINVGSFDLFELGPLAGFSTAAAAPGNWGSFHIGARSNINIGSHFGITGAARVNKAYWIADFGVKFKI